MFSSKIDLVAYINLECRPDKKIETEIQLDRLGVPKEKIIRWEATHTPGFGILGCVLSHIALQEYILKERPDVSTILILEDDFNFIDDTQLVQESLEKFLNLELDWDLALLAYQVCDKENYDDFLSLALMSFGTAGFLINRKAIPKVLENFKEGRDLLQKTRLTHLYALDVYWWRILQDRKSFFFNKPLGYQRGGLNDIGQVQKGPIESLVKPRNQNYIDSHKPMKKSSITFVSALIECSGEKRSDAFSIEKYFSLFEPLAASNLNLIVFISQHLFEAACKRWPHIKFESINLPDLDTARVILSSESSLPLIRTSDKDTRTYLTLINCKTELVSMVIKRYPKTSYYAWIDFGISKVLKKEDPIKTLRLLKDKLESGVKFKLAIPGCWKYGFRIKSINSEINWRFCGGFFVGDEQSILDFDQLSRRVLSENIRETGTLSWEVNTWALMEYKYGWKPDWYHADHNESMLRIPFD